MRGYTDSQLARIGAVFVVTCLVLMAAAVNLQKFPGFRGVTYTAALSDASGLRDGNMVQVAGTDVGKVKDIELAGDHVIVHFEVDGDVELGERTRASVEVLNLLGEKFLNLQPEGGGTLQQDARIPLERTQASYDIVRVFDQLANTTERIDTRQLSQSLDVLSDTLERSDGEVQASFQGLSRISQAVADRDTELQSLLRRADSVTELLAQRKGDIVALLKDGDLLMQELRQRREVIHTLLVNARTLSEQLRGLVEDNQEQLRPAFEDLNKTLRLLKDQKKKVNRTLRAYGPYVDILSNIVGTGPFFDGYVVNLLRMFTDEFRPGAPGYMPASADLGESEFRQGAPEHLSGEPQFRGMGR